MAEFDLQQPGVDQYHSENPADECAGDQKPLEKRNFGPEDNSQDQHDAETTEIQEQIERERTGHRATPLFWFCHQGASFSSKNRLRVKLGPPSSATYQYVPYWWAALTMAI